MPEWVPDTNKTDDSNEGRGRAYGPASGGLPDRTTSPADIAMGEGEVGGGRGGGSLQHTAAQLALAEGDRVQLAGLVNSGHLNGRIATVRSVLEGGRAWVRLISAEGGAAGEEGMGDKAPPNDISVKLDHLIPLSSEFVGRDGDGGDGDRRDGGRKRRDRVPKSDIKLYKQWLSSSDAAGGGARDLYANHTIPRRFASEMLEIAAAHSSYKFLLRVTGAGGGSVSVYELCGCGSVKVCERCEFGGFCGASMQVYMV